MDRTEYAQALLAIEFEDGDNYTVEELAAMSDAEIAEAYKEEMSEDTDTPPEPPELEKCVACGEMKVCENMTEDTEEPICDDCTDELGEDDEEDGAVFGDDEEEGDEDEDGELEDEDEE